LQPLSPFPLWSFADYLPIVLKYGIITDVKVRDVIKMIEEDG
jgi:hypothetical protein